MLEILRSPSLYDKGVYSGVKTQTRKRSADCRTALMKMCKACGTLSEGFRKEICSLKIANLTLPVPGK